MVEMDTEEVTRTVPAEPGDHDKLSHYANNAQILTAMVNGTPIEALCGKVWVPTRDGTKFPVCPECKEIYERLPD